MHRYDSSCSMQHTVEQCFVIWTQYRQSKHLSSCSMQDKQQTLQRHLQSCLILFDWRCNTGEMSNIFGLVRSDTKHYIKTRKHLWNHSMQDKMLPSSSFADIVRARQQYGPDGQQPISSAVIITCRYKMPFSSLHISVPTTCASVFANRHQCVFRFWIRCKSFLAWWYTSTLTAHMNINVGFRLSVRYYIAYSISAHWLDISVPLNLQVCSDMWSSPAPLLAIPSVTLHTSCISAALPARINRPANCWFILFSDV